MVAEDGPTTHVSHLYDQWGNEQTRTTTGGTSLTETYQYNHLNLLSVYLRGAVASGQYDYWPSGERYSKITTSGTEIYVPRHGDVGAEYSDAATLKNVYVQGTGIDQKQIRIAAGADGIINAGDERRHYLGDQVGTVSVTLSDTGAVVESNLKDVWGMPITLTASAERYGFAQREQDNESGLVHMRARQYDPRIGRFTQTDPLLGNRATEHYAYARGNPVSVTDPLGLEPPDDESTLGPRPTRPRFDPEAQLREQRRLIAEQNGPNKTASELLTKSLGGSGKFEGEQVVIDTSKKLKEESFREKVTHTSAGDVKITKNWEHVIAEELIAAVLGGAMLGPASGGISAVRSGPLRFTQTTASPLFSAEGNFAGKSINQVAKLLRSGEMKLADVPVEYVVRNGNRLIVNTRSSLALRQAGIPEAQWNLVNRTGISKVESDITKRLAHNELSSEGSEVLRITGSGPNASTYR